VNQYVEYQNSRISGTDISNVICSANPASQTQPEDQFQLFVSDCGLRLLRRYTSRLAALKARLRLKTHPLRGLETRPPEAD